jgi:hypothetical protein
MGDIIFQKASIRAEIAPRVALHCIDWLRWHTLPHVDHFPMDSSIRGSQAIPGHVVGFHGYPVPALVRDGRV